MTDNITDPTNPRVPLKLGKSTYYLCFTYDALRLAESEIRKLGHEVNLLHSLDFDSLDATTLVPLLYAAMLTHQPETSATEVAALIKFRFIGKIREALMTAFIASLADPADADEDDPSIPLVE